MAGPKPKTKAELLALVNDYLQDTSPNIRSSEHREIETAILDRVDARILQTGQITRANQYGYWYQDITFTTPTYNTDYLVWCTIVQGGNSGWGISNKTVTGFRINVTNYYTLSINVWYMVFSRDTSL